MPENKAAHVYPKQGDGGSLRLELNPDGTVRTSLYIAFENNDGYLDLPLEDIANALRKLLVQKP